MILTCGCKSSYGGFPSEWDTQTKKCEDAVAYGNLCDKHFYEYEARPAAVHPDNLGLALSIIDQQKLEIERLKTHPVKQLSEEAVLSVFKDTLGILPSYAKIYSVSDGDLIEFANAIIKEITDGI